MVVCSATLHSFEVKKMAEKLMHFPTWIDLKGQDSVPETVHHVVLHVDPKADQSWKTMSTHVKVSCSSVDILREKILLHDIHVIKDHLCN